MHRPFFAFFKQVKPKVNCIEAVDMNGSLQNGTIISKTEETAKSETNQLLHQMLTIMKETQALKKSKEEEEVTKSDWILVAMVIDRFMLITFFCITAILIPIILTNYPSYSDQFDIPE